MITTGAFAVVPFALSSAPAAAAEAAPTVDWGPITSCESGGNPQATNASSTASGLYQFLDSSWAAYGGSRYAHRAKDATPAQQTEIANTAYQRSGLSPWKASQHCWSGKVSTALARPGPATRPQPVHTAARPSGPQHALDVPAPRATPQPAPSTDTYQVRAGDTLTRIAASRGMSWQSVWAANKDSVAQPNLLHPGDQLRLPQLRPTGTAS
ncbi:MAG: transglycosylase family protein [Pseudonocardia sp.]